jgi:hypothetical protein
MDVRDVALAKAHSTVGRLNPGFDDPCTAQRCKIDNLKRPFRPLVFE